MEYLLPLGAALAVAAIFWFAFQYAQTAFIVRIKFGRPQIAKGKLTAGFLQELEDVCREHQIESGTIRGMKRGRRIALKFSAGIPPACQQRLRNVWVMQRR